MANVLDLIRNLNKNSPAPEISAKINKPGAQMLGNGLAAGAAESLKMDKLYKQHVSDDPENAMSKEDFVKSMTNPKPSVGLLN